jgi:hypothetical protein
MKTNINKLDKSLKCKFFNKLESLKTEQIDDILEQIDVRFENLDNISDKITSKKEELQKIMIELFDKNKLTFDTLNKIAVCPNLIYSRDDSRERLANDERRSKLGISKQEQIEDDELMFKVYDILQKIHSLIDSYNNNLNDINNYVVDLVNRSETQTVQRINSKLMDEYKHDKSWSSIDKTISNRTINLLYIDDDNDNGMSNIMISFIIISSSTDVKYALKIFNTAAGVVR